MKEHILAVQRMQDYIEENLEQEITLADLARVSLFSPWHSYRLFQALTGYTPTEYIRRLRLSRSAMMLKKERGRILDAAFDCGFQSADGYTRAFRREFGCNPGAYVNNPVPLSLFVPYGVKFRELRKDDFDMENLQSVFVQVIRKPERKVIIKRGVKAADYFSYCEEVGCDVWGTLLSMDSLCGEPVCLWLPEQYKKPGTSTYVQGVEVEAEYSGAIPEGFDMICLPEAEYLMFQGEPFEEENYGEAIMAVQKAIERYVPSVIGYEWDDENPRIQLEPRGARGYIELRAVKKKTAS
ncbi:MAG: AraC family transcriptional regulator [Eubacteriales bacterium]|nr:AraC family transcriptional regulator [Eubacteriales bacterium]